MHQIKFELKKRGVFDEALLICQSYYSSFSHEAMLAKLYKSKNPINYFMRISLCFMMFIVNQVEFFDSRLIKKRGSSFLWGFIGMSSSCLGIIAIGYWMKNPGYLSSAFLVSVLLSSVFSSALFEDRLNSNNK